MPVLHVQKQDLIKNAALTKAMTNWILVSREHCDFFFLHPQRLAVLLKLYPRLTVSARPGLLFRKKRPI